MGSFPLTTSSSTHSRSQLGDALDLGGLSAADVVAFVVACCPAQSRGAAKMTVTALRSLLGFLHLRAGAAPPPGADDRDLRQGRSRSAAPAGAAVARDGGPVMIALEDRLAGYLAVRRALGYRLARAEKLLAQFIAWLQERGEQTARSRRPASPTLAADSHCDA